MTNIWKRMVYLGYLGAGAIILRLILNILFCLLGIDLNKNQNIECSGSGVEDDNSLTPKVAEEDSEDVKTSRKNIEEIQKDIQDIATVGTVILTGIAVTAAGATMINPVDPDSVGTGLIAVGAGAGAIATNIIANRLTNAVEEMIPVNYDPNNPPSPGIDPYGTDTVVNIKENSIPNLPLMIIDSIKGLDETSQLVICIVILIVISILIYNMKRWKNNNNKSLNKRWAKKTGIYSILLKYKNLVNKGVNMWYNLIIGIFLFLAIIGILTLILL
uniref:hypothetical protein n=1 Tax=Capillidium rhysosporum TaxID=181046 RepID=UPI0020C839B8|nr:hypothetical protein NNX69_mgp14 [Capillidium rhysosporum]QWY25709.1 hypothetical protein [Capillidium rhysosporum]